MTINVETTLRDTRDQLRKLGEAIENLVKSYPDVFDGLEIASRLEAFRQAHREAVDRLNAPSLCIATIGTTSSGKSTIVNALIGRKVAPIEAGEMSGGVLTLQNADERRLVIEATEGAAWEIGEWSELNDEELYNQIRDGVMRPYHEIRRKQKDCIAPQVTAFGPLLPASEPNLLGLPLGVGVELIDLPGLKSVQDRANLAVIQTRVHKAFSLVALDYMQVDDEHRKRLLEELKRVVQYLQGRTDSMIFVLNRVDQRGADDIPISERINKLQEEIQEVLSLPEPPEVLPFSARLLYYAQCAWGAGSFYSPSQVDQPTRLKLLKAMFQDCAGTINQYTENDWDLDDWLRNVRRQVSKGDHISDETMRQILRYALEWSGGNQLWSRLQVRVQESFPELVLLPALVEVFDSYDALAAALDSLVEVRKIKQKEEVEAEQQRVSNSRQQLHQKIEELRNSFSSEIKEDIEDIKTSESEFQLRVAQKAQAKKRQGFEILIEASEEVKKDLNLNLIDPVLTALKEKTEAYELEDKLRDIIPDTLANDIARAYDTARNKLDSFNEASGYLIKRAREDNTNELRKLENAERAVRKLYQAMRDALSVRAEFNLQGQAKKLQKGLRGLAEEAAQQLYELVRKELPSLKLDEAVIADFKKKVYQNLPDVPEKFFELPDNIKGRRTTEREVIGKKTVTETYTEGSCFSKETKTRTKKEDVHGDVQYRELTLPNADTMAEQWLLGIQKNEEGLWNILCSWITGYLNWMSSEFNSSVDNVLNLAERTLQEQLKIIEQNFEAEMKGWLEIETQKGSVTIVRQQLEYESRTQRDL